MLEMKITINALDLAEAINNLAAAVNSNRTLPVPKEATPAASAPVAQPAIPVAPLNPATAPTAVPVATSASAAPVANTEPASAIPTSAPHYTLDMIATADSCVSAREIRLNLNCKGE